MTYHWEVQPMEEVEPHFLFTEKDSIAEASRRFEEAWGSLSIRYIRKIAVTEKIEYSDLDCWEVS